MPKPPPPKTVTAELVDLTPSPTRGEVIVRTYTGSPDEVKLVMESWLQFKGYQGRLKGAAYAEDRRAKPTAADTRIPDGAARKEASPPGGYVPRTTTPTNKPRPTEPNRRQSVFTPQAVEL